MNSEYLLNESKTFCVLPWIHLMVMPSGDAYPCCVGVDSPKYGSVTTHSITEIINNEQFKLLRSNMMAGKQTSFCNSCYDFEKFGSSFRTYNNEIFKKYIDEIIANTNEDGHIENFKIRYLDSRFRNICNFKCRTCGPDYSSSWATEENKFENTKHKILNITQSSNFLPEVLESIDDIDMFYFAGGEPLIMDEHYILLEELIKRKRTDVTIRYNTNCSTLKYKDKDVLDLWKNFKSIFITASIDHIEERAEYIRHGTDWGIIDSNLRLLRTIPNLNITINTVLSVFNYVTLDIVYDYLRDIGIFHHQSWFNSIINTTRPSYFSATALPKVCKDLGTERIKKFIEKLEKNSYTSQIDLFKNAINFTNSKDDWEKEKSAFNEQNEKKDKQRNESFSKTFPELKPMWAD